MVDSFVVTYKNISAEFQGGKVRELYNSPYVVSLLETELSNMEDNLNASDFVNLLYSKIDHAISRKYSLQTIRLASVTIENEGVVVSVRR